MVKNLNVRGEVFVILKTTTTTNKQNTIELISNYQKYTVWRRGRGMYCSVYGKVHIKDPLLLIEKSSLCGGSGFPSKKCVNVTI